MLLGSQVGDVGFDRDGGIESRDLSGGSNCFWQGFGGVRFIEERLPLQIAGLDIIAINDANRAHTRAGKQGSQRRPGRSAAYNSNTRRGQLALAFSPNSAKKHLPGISLVQFQRGHQFYAYKPL